MYKRDAFKAHQVGLPLRSPAGLPKLPKASQARPPPPIEITWKITRVVIHLGGCVHQRLQANANSNNCARRWTRQRGLTWRGWPKNAALRRNTCSSTRRPVSLLRRRAQHVRRAPSARRRPRPSFTRAKRLARARTCGARPPAASRRMRLKRERERAAVDRRSSTPPTRLRHYRR